MLIHDSLRHTDSENCGIKESKSAHRILIYHFTSAGYYFYNKYK